MTIWDISCFDLSLSLIHTDWCPSSNFRTYAFSWNHGPNGTDTCVPHDIAWRVWDGRIVILDRELSSARRAPDPSSMLQKEEERFDSFFDCSRQGCWPHEFQELATPSIPFNNYDIVVAKNPTCQILSSIMSRSDRYFFIWDKCD